MGISYYYSQCYKWGSKRQKSCTNLFIEKEFQSCFSKTICLDKIQFCLEKFCKYFKIKTWLHFLIPEHFIHISIMPLHGEVSWFCLVLLQTSEQCMISEKCGAFVFVLPVSGPVTLQQRFFGKLFEKWILNAANNNKYIIRFVIF